MMDEDHPNVVAEPVGAYLAAHAVVAHPKVNERSVDRIIAYGGPGSINPIPGLLEVSGLSHKFLAESVLEVTPKTFSKYKSPSYVFPARMAETTIKLLDLYHLGIEVFGTREQFQAWMNQPAHGLNHIVPLTILRTVTGIDLIIEELQRIAFGALA